MITAASLFSGIGAPETSMPDWDWRWCAEIEKFPSAVLKKRHPESVNLGDVNAEDFVARAAARGRPNVIVFGSPCQSFSIAGKRLGLDDARGNLALIALGIAKRLRPEWVVFENVPGIFSSYSGSEQEESALNDRISADGWHDAGGFTECDEDSDFAALVSAFRECGYLGGYRVFDAQHSGVPQRRRRLFFVGYLGDWRPAAAVLLEPDSLRGDRPPSRAPGEGITHPIAPSLTSSGRGVERAGDTRGQDSVIAVLPLAGAVSAKWSKGTGGPAGDECYNLAAADVAPTVYSIMPQNSGKDFKARQVQVAQPLMAGGPVGGNQGGDYIVQSAAMAYRTTGNDGVYETGDKVDALTTATDPCHTVLCFEPRARGDDGRGYEREPNFIEECSPTLNTVKTPVIAFDETQITHPENRSQPDDRSPQLAAGARPPTIAFASDVSGPLMAQANESGGNRSPGMSADSAADQLVTVFKPSHFTCGKDGAPADIAPALSADADKGDQDPVLMQGAAVRRLTPRECERLQAFPDDYTLITFRGKPAADGPRYRALGNSMNVKDIGAILRRIDLFERTVRK